MVDRLKRVTAMMILNSVKEREQIEQLYNCNTEEEILALPFMVGARPFENLNGIADNEMGMGTPIFRFTDKSLYTDESTDYTFDENFDWWLNELTIDDIGRRCYSFDVFDFIYKSFSDGIEATMEGVPFTRIGAYCSNDIATTDVNVLKNTTPNGDDIFKFSAGLGEIKIKSILGDTITPHPALKVKYDDNYYNEIRVWSRYCYQDSQGNLNLGGGGYNVGTNIYDYGMNPPEMYYYKPSVLIESNTWIFNNENDLDDYLRTGDYSKAINYNPVQKPIDQGDDNYKIWFINSNIKRGRTTSTLTDYEKNYFKMTADNVASKRPIVGYIIESDNGYNVKLKINNPNVIKDMKQSFDGGISYTDTNYRDYKNPAWGYLKKSNVRRAGGFYFKYSTRTNIPIFGSEEDADKYLNFEIDETSAINEIEPPVEPSDIGYDKENSELNDTIINVVLSKTLILNYSTLSEISRTLYNEQDITEILDGLKLMGETPLNFICDLFAIPFNPKPFCATTQNRTMFYGLYSVQMSNAFDEIVHCNNVLTMFSQRITGNFNDWRDYMQNYYLYLPYVGITAIDIEKYMYKTMTCKVQCDVRTGTIKYYLLSNNVIMDTFEGSVRVSMPLIGTNNYAATMSKIGAVSNIATSVTSAGGGLAGTDEKTNKLKTGLSSAGGLAGSIAGNVGNVATLTGATPKHCSGNFSSQTAVMDELTAYLIIDAQEIIYPDSITMAYNLPDSRYGVIGANSGYIQLDSVNLNTRATEEEQSEILTLLNSGIIL